MLVILDAGGIGSDIEVILNHTKRKRNKGARFQFLLPECFEQVLLCSQYFCYDEDIFEYFKIEYNDTENFCEQELTNITKGTVLVCNHDTGEMSNCWYKQCTECTNTCQYRVDNKYKYVLEKGPLKALLELI